MSPAIRDGEVVYMKPSPGETLHRGDIVLVKGDRGFRLHRLILADACRDVFITRGDRGLQDDPAVRRAQILGVAVAKEVRVGRAAVTARFKGSRGKLLRTLARGQAALRKVVVGTRLW